MHWISIIILLVPSFAYAQVCGLQDYDSTVRPNFECPSPGEDSLSPRLRPPASVAVEAGTSVTAEWEGALVHRDRMLELGLRIQAIRSLRWLDRVKLSQEHQLVLQHTTNMFDTRIASVQAQLQDAKQQLERRSAGWRSPILWFTVGFVVAAVVVALTAYALTAVN